MQKTILITGASSGASDVNAVVKPNQEQLIAAIGMSGLGALRV